MFSQASVIRLAVGGQLVACQPAGRIDQSLLAIPTSDRIGSASQVLPHAARRVLIELRIVGQHNVKPPCVVVITGRPKTI